VLSVGLSFTRMRGILPGKWSSEESPPGQPTTTCLFGYDGRLAYVEELPDKHRVARLLYKEEEDRIITIQPSTGVEEASEIEWLDEQHIRIAFQGIYTTYKKVAGPDLAGDV
jgi:hypothetical protein